MECGLILRAPDPAELLDRVYRDIDEHRIDGWEYDDDGNIYPDDAGGVLRFMVVADRDRLHWEFVPLGDKAPEVRQVARRVGDLVATLIASYGANIREIVVF